MKDATGQALGYFYFEKESGRRLAAKLAATAARTLFNLGCRTLQAYLGHRNIQHTVRYTELSPTRFKDFQQD